MRTWLAKALPGAAVLGLAAGCGASSPRPQPTASSQHNCDDAVATTEQVPPAMRAQGIARGVGGGDVWFIDPEIARWSDRLTLRGGGASAKIPIWVGSSHLPDVKVTGTHGTSGSGTVQLAPTSEGVPGPVPMGIDIPARGCWQVTAKGESGSANIVINADSGWPKPRPGES